MIEELKKRLEEAANQYCKDYGRTGVINGRDVTAFMHGGEFMFKECGGMAVLHDMRRLIKNQVIDIVRDIANNDIFGDWEQAIRFANDVENAIDKFWEGEK